MQRDKGVTLRLVILGTAFCIQGQSQQPVIPSGAEQIASWVVEQVWNKGDFRLVNQMFASGALLQLSATRLPTDTGFQCADCAELAKWLPGLSFQDRRPDRPGEQNRSRGKF